MGPDQNADIAALAGCIYLAIYLAAAEHVDRAADALLHTL